MYNLLTINSRFIYIAFMLPPSTPLIKTNVNDLFLSSSDSVPGVTLDVLVDQLTIPDYVNPFGKSDCPLTPPMHLATHPLILDYTLFQHHHSTYSTLNHALSCLGGIGRNVMHMQCVVPIKKKGSETTYRL